MCGCGRTLKHNIMNNSRNFKAIFDIEDSKEIDRIRKFNKIPKTAGYTSSGCCEDEYSPQSYEPEINEQGQMEFYEVYEYFETWNNGEWIKMVSYLRFFWSA